MSIRRESCGCGTVPSMTLNFSHGPSFVFFQIMCSDGVKVREGAVTLHDSELWRFHRHREYDWRRCAFPVYTAFDASRLFAGPDMEPPAPAPRCRVTGSEHLIGDSQRIQRYRVDASRSCNLERWSWNFAET